MKENVKLGIYDFVSAFLGMLAIIFLSLPSYIESDSITLTGFQLVFGNTRTDFNGLLFFGFLLLLLGILVILTAGVFQMLNKFNSPLFTTIFGIVAAVCILAGGIILTCAIPITGLDKANSELGLVQGNWSIGPSNYLVLIFSLISFGFCYPSALIILHHKDLADKQAAQTTSSK